MSVVAPRARDRAAVTLIVLAGVFAIVIGWAVTEPPAQAVSAASAAERITNVVRDPNAVQDPSASTMVLLSDSAESSFGRQSAASSATSGDGSPDNAAEIVDTASADVYDPSGLSPVDSSSVDLTGAEPFAVVDPSPLEATPNCPGVDFSRFPNRNTAGGEQATGAGMSGAARPEGDAGLGAASPDQSQPCKDLLIHGSVFHDVNGNGRYDPYHGPESLLEGLEVRLYDAASNTFLGYSISNHQGYYRFPLLPVGPIYRVEIALPPGYRNTTATVVELTIRDFSTLWCCSTRVDFGVIPGQVTMVPPTPMPPVGPQGTPVPPPCCDRPSGRQIHLPILNYLANENVCSSVIEAQNVGAWPSKAILMVWGAPGACPPQCTGPLKVECSGLLRPGTAWHFMGDQVPRTAKSGMVFSAPAIDVGGVPGAGGGDVFADILCETLFHHVVGDCNEWRRFKKAFNENGIWIVGSTMFDFGMYPGASMAVEVVRKCPGDTNPMVSVAGAYTGLADEMLGAYDQVYGGYAFFAPLLYADKNGFNSWMYIQNGGLECSSVEIWFRAQDDCLRPRVCDIVTLAPGETHQFDASSCVGPDWVGSAWVRGSEPMGVVVDTVGRDLLMTYHGHPSELKYSFVGAPTFTVGSPVAYGPLLYSEYQGWDSLVQVQNLSQTTNAKVKVYFLDRGGNVITAVVDWICAGGSQGFYLPIVAQLPGNWVGSVRVESQDWFSPGQPQVQAPDVVGVVQLIKYADLARMQPLEAMAYDLFPEQRAFDWQIGSGWGGLYSGVGRIGVPSFMKDVGGTGLTSELAIANLVPKPGFTDFVVYVYDQNGLVHHFCEKLSERQVEYIDAEANLAFLPSGFKGSAVISAVFWEHDVFGPQGAFLRNLVGLAAVTVERSGTTQGADIPGDESAISEGFPIIGPFAFSGPWPNCPGVPAMPPGPLPGQPTPLPQPGQPTPPPAPTNVPAPWPTTTTMPPGTPPVPPPPPVPDV